MLWLCFAVRRFSRPKIWKQAQHLFSHKSEHGQSCCYSPVPVHAASGLTRQCTPKFPALMSKNRTRDASHPRSGKRLGCCKFPCLHPGSRPLLPAKTNVNLVDSWLSQSKRIMQKLTTDHFCFSMMQLSIINKIKKEATI